MSSKITNKKFNPLHMETPRLIIRQWQPSDYEPFAEMNRDPEVMRYLLKQLTKEESDALIERGRTMIENDKYGFWALETKENNEFIGFVALAKVLFECSFTGSIEIGWRLKQSAWGKGYATEGARKLLEYGFEALNLSEIISMTAKVNRPSSRVMERIGMKTNPADDFDHPKVPEGSPLKLHVLYRLSRYP